MHWINRGAIDLAISLLWSREAGDTPRAQISDALRWCDSAAATHHFHEHRLTVIGRLALESDAIVAIFAGRRGVAVHLLASWVSDFRGAEFRGFANDSAALDFDQLVNQIQMRRITRRGKRGAYAERVNRGVFRQQRGDARFVEVT